MIVSEENYLKHYGIARKSGRYPWGSGGDENARAKAFFAFVKEMKSSGMTDTQIAEVVNSGLGPNDPKYTSTHFRATKTMALAASKAADISKAQELQAQGLSNGAIGRKFNPPKNESTVRALLSDSARDKINILNQTSDMLRSQVQEKGIVDVGKGVQNELGISKEKLRTAIAVLEAEGFVSFPVQIPQLGATNKTTVQILGPPGTTYKQVVQDRSQIKTLGQLTDDGGRSWYGMLPPLPVSSSRVSIKYAEDGGKLADGVMYIRPGVKDLDMEHARYAQVRINVDGTHYLKGMAVYKNDLPDGVDIQFNTNKTRAEAPNVHDVLKKQTGDKDNPFGAVVDQIGHRDPITGRVTKVTSALNIVNKEGDWDTWGRNLSSQTLSKQSPSLAKQQLDMTFEKKKNEFDTLNSLTNPTVKQHLLEKFADSADASAVHLKAAALPRSSWHVILPVNSLPEHKVFAPNFPNGTKVALIRYPHGGKFEIPELEVDNSHAPARKLLGSKGLMPKDAIGINAKVAERLSGADFDGDAVLVIPNNHGGIRTMPPLQGLKNFDPQTMYRPYDGMKTVDGGTWNEKTREVDFPEGKKSNPRGKGTQMGMVSNLITDMTIQGAPTHELAAAVRHSMVVIDAEKHHLNYKQSAINNNIASLKAKYQGGTTRGAATLISRATSEQRVRARKDQSQGKGGPVDKVTGKRLYEDRGDSWVDPKTGLTRYPTQKSTKLFETDDAHTLVSKADTKMEHVYADHSNKLKALANEARRVAVNIPAPRVDPSAKRVYAEEVKSLTAKLNLALRNAPRERAAQVLAGGQIAAKLRDNPGMDEAHIKRIKSQALEEARHRTGAKKDMVVFEGREWEAIQAGALPGSKLKAILANTNIDGDHGIKALATPRAQLTMSNAKTARAKSMAASGYTQNEIAQALGVSLTTLKEGIK